MNKLKIAILKNEIKDSHQSWEAACIKQSDKITFTIIDLTTANWLENIRVYAPNILLIKPGGVTSHFKQLYDERIMILARELNYFCFPSLNEVLIYENKRFFSYWLKAHQLPHPETHVFYLRSEANEYIKNRKFPIVAKVNIGASGSGVTVLKDLNSAQKYIDDTFSGKGAKKRNGPNLEKGGILRRGLNYILNPRRILAKLVVYKKRALDIQKHFVIFQEYVPHEFEWRVVRMGDSFFAHKKVKKGEKASGTLNKKYENPPLSILDFVKELTDRFGFFSQAVDIFDTSNGYLINEMQCIFGQSDPYQMLVEGVAGRYIQKEKGWVFEAGDFTSNESYDLRLKTALELFEMRNQ